MVSTGNHFHKTPMFSLKFHFFANEYKPTLLQLKAWSGETNVTPQGNAANSIESPDSSGILEFVTLPVHVPPPTLEKTHIFGSVEFEMTSRTYRISKI